MNVATCTCIIIIIMLMFKCIHKYNYTILYYIYLFSKKALKSLNTAPEKVGFFRRNL